MPVALRPGIRGPNTRGAFKGDTSKKRSPATFLTPAAPGQVGSSAVTTMTVNISSIPDYETVFVFGIVGDAQTTPLRAPSGWGILARGSEGTSGGNSSASALFWHVKSPGEMSVTFTWNQSQKCQFQGVCFPGWNVVDKVAWSSHTAGTTYPTTSLTPTEADSIAVYFAGTRGTTAIGTFTPDAALDEISDVSTTASPFVGIEIANSLTRITLAAHSYTATNTQSNSHGGQILLLLRQGPIAPPVIGWQPPTLWHPGRKPGRSFITRPFGDTSIAAAGGSVSGDVALSTTSGMTIDGVVAIAGSASMASTEAITAVGVVAIAGSVSLPTIEAMTVAGNVGAIGNVSLSTTAGMTVVGSVGGASGVTGDVTITSTESTTVTGVVAIAGSATLSTTAGMTIVGVVAITGAVTMPAAAALAVAGSVTSGVVGAVTLAATSGLTVAGTVGRVGSVSLEAVAGLTTAQTLAATGAVIQSLTGSLTASGVVARSGGMSSVYTAGLLVVASVTGAITYGTAIAGEGSSAFGRVGTDHGSQGDTGEGRTAYAGTGTSQPSAGIPGESPVPYGRSGQ